jgi:hypothetical protein
MRANINRKPRAEAILKNLAPAMQEALWDYSEGSDKTPGHSLDECVAWLASDGIKTVKQRVSEWRYWYAHRLLMKRAEAATLETVKQGREEGWINSMEEEQKIGQAFFTKLAISQADNLSFVRIVREQTRQRQFEIQARRLNLMEEREAKVKTVVQSTLTAEEKEQRYREILGM